MPAAAAAGELPMNCMLCGVPHSLNLTVLTHRPANIHTAISRFTQQQSQDSHSNNLKIHAATISRFTQQRSNNLKIHTATISRFTQQRSNNLKIHTATVSRFTQQQSQDSHSNLKTSPTNCKRFSRFRFFFYIVFTPKYACVVHEVAHFTSDMW